MEIKIATFYQQLELELNIKNKFLSNLKRPIFKDQLRGILEVYLCNVPFNDEDTCTI